MKTIILVQWVGVEPTYDGFTDHCLTARLPLVLLVNIYYILDLELNYIEPQGSLLGIRYFSKRFCDDKEIITFCTIKLLDGSLTGSIPAFYG